MTNNVMDGTTSLTAPQKNCIVRLELAFSVYAIHGFSESSKEDADTTLKVALEALCKEFVAKVDKFCEEHSAGETEEDGEVDPEVILTQTDDDVYPDDDPALCEELGGYYDQKQHKCLGLGAVGDVTPDTFADLPQNDAPQDIYVDEHLEPMPTPWEDVEQHDEAYPSDSPDLDLDALGADENYEDSNPYGTYEPGKLADDIDQYDDYTNNSL